MPYPRHRLAVSHLLGADEADLWPEVHAARSARSRPEGLMTVYPHRWAVPHDVWRGGGDLISARILASESWPATWSAIPATIAASRLVGVFPRPVAKAKICMDSWAMDCRRVSRGVVALAHAKARQPDLRCASGWPWLIAWLHRDRRPLIHSSKEGREPSNTAATHQRADPLQPDHDASPVPAYCYRPSVLL